MRPDLPSSGSALEGKPADAVVPPADHSTLVLHLLGTPCWQRWNPAGPQGASVPLNWRDAMLLAMLACDGPQPRDRLVWLLWPAAPTLQAGRLSLRQRLHRLRLATEHALVRAGDTLELDKGGLECDLWPAVWERSGHWPEGELLEGLECGSEPPLGHSHEALVDWLGQARLRQAQAWQQSLEAACARAAQAGDPGRTARLCRQWLRRWPWSEAQWRRLIEALYLAGDLTQASEAVTQMQSRLVDDLGLEPTASTRALIETLERAQRDRQRLLRLGVPSRAGTEQGPQAAPTATSILADRNAATRGALAMLRTLDPAALSLARALALIEQALPDADPVGTAARILQTSVLALATPWRELEEAAVLQAGRIADPALRQALLDGIPAALRAHLQAALRAAR